MTDDNGAKGIDGDEIRDPPEDRKGQCPCNHEPGTKDAKGEGASEALKKFRHFLEKIGLLDLLCRRTPSHVNFEEMTKKCL